MPNQEPAPAWSFGNSSVRVGTQGLFRPYLKTLVTSFLPTRLTAPGSPRMGWIRVVLMYFTIIARVFMLRISRRKSNPKKELSQKFCRILELMLNFRLLQLEIWPNENISFSSNLRRAGALLDRFCKLDHHISNHINPFMSVKLSLLVFYLKPKQMRYTQLLGSRK